MKGGRKAINTHSQPWLDSDCHNLRRNYYRVKNQLKHIGAKRLANTLPRKVKNFMKKKEDDYYHKLGKKIRFLRSQNRKDYWDLLNKSAEGKKIYSKICLETFLDHFKKLNEAPAGTEDFILPDMPNENEFLNKYFEPEEILKRIRSLKNNKSAGIDFIRNEFLKKSSHVHIAFYCRLFNLILDTGFIPDVWCQGIILPLYKNKGRRDDPDNYRGITLLSCLGKLFTACISERISMYLDDENILGFEQAGFRKEFSTIDHVFTLHSIIEFYKSKGKRLYCAFVDYRKAFDLINRSNLWSKLLDYGVNGKVLKVIMNMYNNAKSCVKSSDKLSDFFSCGQGVRQGENLSPVLFALYLNDFSNFMSDNCTGLKSLDNELFDKIGVYLRLYVLLYADDTIILAESADDIQEALHSLKQYCDEWNLNVNITKTKIVIFSRGKVRIHPVFKFGEEIVDVVDDYIYLGVTFNYNGSFKKAIAKQIMQAKKAMFLLLQKAKVLRLPIDIVFDLYEKCVEPVLLYGSELWGCEDLRSVDIFHRNFLRIVLKVCKYTPKCMLYGESGSVDMSTKINMRMVNFFVRLKTCKKEKFSYLLCKLLQAEASDTANDYNFKWHNKLNAIASEIDCNFMCWDSGNVICDKITVKNRCYDLFVKNWKADRNQNSQCVFYKMFKSEFAKGKYLETPCAVYFYLLKFIMRNHYLPVTFDRFNKNDAADSDKICTLCNLQELGDESHYLFKCSYFHASRRKFLPNVSSTNCDVSCLSNMNQDELKSLSYFVKGIINYFKKNGHHIISSKKSKICA